MESNPEQVIYFQGRNSLSAVSDPSGESREMPDKDEVFFSVPDITIIGEPVTMGSLAAVIEQKYGKRFSCSVRWRSQGTFAQGR